MSNAKKNTLGPVREMSRVMSRPVAKTLTAPFNSAHLADAAGNQILDEVKPVNSNTEWIANRLVETKERLAKLELWIESERAAIMVERKPRVDEGGPIRHEMPPFFNAAHDHLDDINRIISSIEEQVKRMEI